MSRIAVTGMGALSPAGQSLSAFWESLYSGRTVYGPLEEFADNPQCRIKIGARIRADISALLDTAGCPADIRRKYGKAALYTVYTALEALRDAGYTGGLSGRKTAVIVGTTMGEIETEETLTRLLCSNRSPDRELYRQYPSENLAKAAAEAAGADGMQIVVPAACAAGNYAVALGKHLLEWRLADIVIAGGTDVFSHVAFAGFQRLLSLTPDVCRPFDAERRGLVVGEGSGMLVMERGEDCPPEKKRYGYLLGTGLASNAYHMTAPHVKGEGESEAMRRAIKDAELLPGQIDYISAHGTGTRQNDRVEAAAIHTVFDNAPPPVSSVKSMIGHSMGAASALEMIASFLMLQHQTVLPTMHCRTPDPACALDVVPDIPRRMPLRYILSNSFAFGGQTSSVILGAASCV